MVLCRVHDRYWYTIILWITPVDQSEPVVEPSYQPPVLLLLAVAPQAQRRWVQVESAVMLFQDQTLKPGCFQARVKLAPPLLAHRVHLIGDVL